MTTGARQVLAACPIVLCHLQLAARRSATEPPHREVTSPQAMTPCAACAPAADRGVRREHQPALWFGRLERGRRRSFYGRRFYRSLDQFDRAASLRCKRVLDVLDHAFNLLVRQVLDHIALLDLVLARDKQGETSQVHPRLLAAHLCDGFFSVLTEIA